MRPHDPSALVRVGVLTLALAVSSGCGSSTARVRIMNASPGEGAITATIGNSSIATSLDYGTASSYATVTSGSVALNVQQASSSNTVLDTTLSLGSNNTYTILVANYSTDVSAVTLSDNNSSPASDQFNLRIVQASPGLQAADIYVVSPGTILSSASPTVSDLSFGSASSYLPLAAGTYEVYFTATGQKQAYVDSGPISFSAGEVRTIVALNGSAGGYTAAVLSDLN